METTREEHERICNEWFESFEEQQYVEQAQEVMQVEEHEMQPERQTITLQTEGTKDEIFACLVDVFKNEELAKQIVKIVEQNIETDKTNNEDSRSRFIIQNGSGTTNSSTPTTGGAPTAHELMRLSNCSFDDVDELIRVREQNESAAIQEIIDQHNQQQEMQQMDYAINASPTQTQLEGNEAEVINDNEWQTVTGNISGYSNGSISGYTAVPVNLAATPVLGSVSPPPQLAATTVMFPTTPQHHPHHAQQFYHHAAPTHPHQWAPAHPHPTALIRHHPAPHPPVLALNPCYVNQPVQYAMPSPHHHMMVNPYGGYHASPYTFQTAYQPPNQIAAHYPNQQIVLQPTNQHF